MGTSHCDMLLRSNQNEWKPWLGQKGYRDIKYDYSIPGHNRDVIREYWTESVEMNRSYEVCYTVGMRGIHDTGFVTEMIDRDPLLTGEEKTAKKVALLEEVIADQREILRDVLGEKKGNDAPQTFIPYKEVLDLHDKGLAIPEDVTLIWVDDNFGYMRRYPNDGERKRKGGHGLYYHASYWAAPGMSYLFFNSIPLAQTGNELKKCWESGVRRMWVLNVGALKPNELDTEFFLRYGWEAGRADGSTKNADSFVCDWMNRNFSGGHGSEVSELYNGFAQLTNVCKLEHMQSGKLSQTAYGDEGWWRLNRLRAVFDRANAIALSLPREEQDAFFQMILMKVHAAWYINASFYCADRSRLCYERGAMQAADAYVDFSREMDDRKRRMLYRYNHEICGGKWEGILTPESFSPPPTVLYPAGKPALRIAEPGLLAVAPEGEVEFWAYGQREKLVDIYNQGYGSVRYELVLPAWLEADKEKGFVQAEERVRVRIKSGCEPAVFAEGRCDELLVRGAFGEEIRIAVSARKNEMEVPCGQDCFMEADGCISIPADRYLRAADTPDGRWRVIPGLGRCCGGAVEAFVAGEPSDKGAVREMPCLEYPFCVQSHGTFLLEIYRFLTMNPTGRIRFAVGVDNDPPVVVESDITDEWRGGWDEAVMNDGEKLCLWLPYLVSGYHVLKVYAVDRYVTLTKMVIYTQDKKPSNIGPRVRSTDEQIEEIYDSRALFQIQESEAAIYQSTPEAVPLLPVLYADTSFWKTDRLYVRSDEVQQARLGKAKYLADAKGYKNVFDLFGEGYFAAQGGRIAIGAEYALENSPYAYLTPGLCDNNILWTHTQSETDGRTGMAMMIEGKNLFWERAEQAPAMHYKICVEKAGRYHVWLLVKFEDHKSDACRLALDGRMQHISEQFSANGMFTYSMKQRWNWQAFSDMELTPGVHTFSVYGKKSGLRIDRIYITDGEELPPIDADWEESARTIYCN